MHALFYHSGGGGRWRRLSDAVGACPAFRIARLAGSAIVPRVKVRACVPEDLPAVQSIYAHHVRHGTGSFEEEPPELVEIERRYANITQAGLPFLVAVAEGQVLGYAYAGRYNARSAYRFTCEDSIYVAPGAQRAGVGLALLNELIGACERLGLEQMVAIIGDSGNQASRRLHAKVGFREAGSLERVGFKAGRWLDIVLMQRALRPVRAK
jgi:phosphinothricin acetyltransferase